jgi:hypothetical protein
MFTKFAEMARCPACDDDLGVAMSWEPNGQLRRPSLRLELCGLQRGTMDWRLSLFDNSRQWTSSGFVPGKVHLVYRVCGDGHVFLDHIQMGGNTAVAGWRVDQFDVVAAVGGVAAGKSYLMLRTLGQHLTVSGLPQVATPAHRETVTIYNADWLLEEAPLRLLKEHYVRTEVNGLPLGPTTRRDMLPFELLPEHVASDLVQRILDIHRELLGPDNVDENLWGQRIRQPIVRRYQIGHRRVMLAVADMPGESFDNSSLEDNHRRYLLRNYGTLAWAIDPVICPPFVKFLPADALKTSVQASMRPDVGVDYARAQRSRNSVQHDLATSLTELGMIAEDIGPVQYLLVCVTKADLIPLALRDGASLRDLGPKDAVVNGVARYLAEVATRASGEHRSIMVEEAAWRAIIDPISRFWHDPGLRHLVAQQFGAAIVDHYSDPQNFWELAHSGEGGVIDVPEGKTSSVLAPGRIIIPSLDEHVASSLVPGQAGVLRTRDLVMSALGCGITYGIGFGQKIEILLGQPWRELRFFLCSPLAQVPVKVAESDDLIEPMDSSETFPEFDGRSAALSQLLLCMLRRMRL